MKIKTIGLLTLASVLGTASGATALPLMDFYVGATAGIGHERMYADAGSDGLASQSYGAIVGMDIPMLRIEAEYNYITSKHSEMHLGMLNGYFKIPAPVVKPYIGVGVGDIFSGDMAGIIEVKNQIAFQGMLGLTLDIPVLPFNIDAEGRVLYSPNLIEFAGYNADFAQYDFRIKLRYVF